MKALYVRLLLLTLALVAVLTLFFFPTSDPGAVLDLASGRETETSIVTLSPAFGRGSRHELYSFILSPRLGKYAETVPASTHLVLAKKSVKLSPDGSVSSDWSFAWGYWLLLIVLPSVAVSTVVLWRLRRSSVQSQKTSA